MVAGESVREVIPGVRAWSAFSPEHRVELRSHAVSTAGGWLVFDPIPLPAGATGPVDPVRAVILTGGNHVRDAAAWSARGVPVRVPRGSGTALSEDGGAYADGDGFPPEAWAIALPGGGPGESSWWFPGKSLVVFGDALVNLADRGLEVLPDRYCADPAALRESLRTRLPPGFRHAVFAHGDPLVGDASDRVRALLSSPG